MRGIDFSSWHSALITVLGIVLVSFVAIAIRLLLMHGVQLKRERQNRQINERLKTLIAAYRVLGGSFTGELRVDPTHMRDLRLKGADAAAGDVPAGPEADVSTPGSERRRRTRDAVEAALSDVILLGTEEQVRLAAHAAHEMAAGRAVETAALVLSLREFIREVLDLEPIAVDLVVPRQGPARPAGGGGSRAGRTEKAGGGGGAGGGRGAGAGGGAGGTHGVGAVDDGAVTPMAERPPL